MENNNKKVTYIIIAVAIVLIALGVYYANKAEDADFYKDVATEQPVSQDALMMVNVKHQYKDGKHTYAGELDVPTPCYSLTQATAQDMQNPKSWTLVFTSVASGATCAQVVTSKPFKLSFTAAKEVSISGTLNGKKLRLNLFEVPSNQDLDTYNLYIKG